MGCKYGQKPVSQSRIVPKTSKDKALYELRLFVMVARNVLQWLSSGAGFCRGQDECGLKWAEVAAPYEFMPRQGARFG